VFLPVAQQKEGENMVEIFFESEYVTDCEGVQYYKDEQDGQEYIYSDLEPANCHLWFPCFDQPDLKGIHKFVTFAADDWVVISNTAEVR
jgi:aminopeptidase N